MKSLSAIAKELGVSVATVSYVYNDKWRENRIRPDMAERVRRKLKEEGAVPDALGRQLQSGRTATVGVLLPHLEQPYFLKLLAGIERRLREADYMLFLGVADSQQMDRQAKVAQRMLARRVDALLMCPRPSGGLSDFAASASRTGAPPVVFVDNYLPECRAGRVLSDNRWGAGQAVLRMLNAGRRRILFLGGDSTNAALCDRLLGYSDALDKAGLERAERWIVWRDRGAQATQETLHSLFCSSDRPDAVFATSFFKFLPVLKLLEELGLRHPDDVMLAGFDEPMESWAEDTVRNVIREPLLAVVQAATEMGKQAVDLALAAIDGNDVAGQQRLIRPLLSWEQEE